MKKGYVMTLDSVFAVMLVLFSFFIFSFYHFNVPVTEKRYFERVHIRAEDALQVLDNKGVLEAVGYYWAKGNTESARQLATKNLNAILPQRMGYQLEIGDTRIASRNASSLHGHVSSDEASDKTNSFRLISGYDGKTFWGGYMAQAILYWNISNYTERVRFKPYAKTHTSVNLVFDDPKYSSPPYTEQKVIWVRLPLSATVSEARLNITAGT